MLSQTIKEIASLANDSFCYAEKNNHRVLVVLSGSVVWVQKSLAQFVDRLGELNIVYKDPAMRWISKKNHHATKERLLGEEFKLAVYDCYQGFDPDLFGALSGTLMGGGILVLLAPPLSDWSSFDDPTYKKLSIFPFQTDQIKKRFLTRVATCVLEDHRVALVQQNETLRNPWHESVSMAEGDDSTKNAFHEQEQAVEEIQHVVYGHRRRPLVILSDRGRGKTSALGIAAARLLKNGCEKIVVTAPRIGAVEKLFLHASMLLPEAETVEGMIRYQEKLISFIPPDELLQNPPTANLLIVDEAAAIPTHILSRLLDQYARIVFSTTVHGYEGTGRGFTIRFQSILDRVTPGWRMFKLQAPIRWAKHDPLECFTFRALMLDAQPVAESFLTEFALDACKVQLIDRDSLVSDEKMLQEIFGLLVSAHYRTTPSDLRNLLDGPTLKVFSVFYGKHCVATALVASEGLLETPLVKEIAKGTRRVQGHLIPQSLAFHEGFEEAAQLACARVMRIAVHPALTRRGLGAFLVSGIIEYLAQKNVDYIAASFGATQELVNFWRKVKMNPVRIGLNRDHASGEYSVFVMKALSSRGSELEQALLKRFNNIFPLLLSDPLRELEYQLTACLFRSGQIQSVELDDRTWMDLGSFVFTTRGYESNLFAIHQLVHCALSLQPVVQELSPLHLEMIVRKVLQKQAWQEIVGGMHLTGHQAAVALMREAIGHVLHMVLDERARRWLISAGFNV